MFKYFRDGVTLLAILRSSVFCDSLVRKHSVNTLMRLYFWRCTAQWASTRKHPLHSHLPCCKLFRTYNKVPKKGRTGRLRGEGRDIKFIDFWFEREVSCSIPARKSRARCSIDCKLLEWVMTPWAEFEDWELPRSVDKQHCTTFQDAIDSCTGIWQKSWHWMAKRQA